jgi:very-short-patch-repair endonuclease
MRSGLISTRGLLAAGASRSKISGALRSGSLLRVRRGWYADPATAPDVLTAARVGGRLSCVSALAWHGAWTLQSSAPHVRVASGVDVVRIAGVQLHWTARRIGPGVDSPAEALGIATGCCDLRTLVVTVDSLANRRILPPSVIANVLGATGRGRAALAAHDSSAESGIETLVRLALRRLGIRFRTQAKIHGVGRVDFLIGERLIIETDGYEWHGSREAFERDRERDLELVRRGYLVVRASYRRVVDDVDSVMLAVLDIVRRRDHHWRSVHRTQLSECGYLIDEKSMYARIRES